MVTIRIMKLADYLLQQNLNAAEFTRLLGLSSSATIRRYILGERIPKEEILIRIAEVTGGQVNRQDFVDTASSGGIKQQQRRRRLLCCSFSSNFVQHLDEQQLHDFGLDGWYLREPANENITFPIWQAKQILQGRLEIESNGNLILDGRKKDARQVIEAANGILQMMGKHLIHYPGLHPIHQGRKMTRAASKA